MTAIFGKTLVAALFGDAGDPQIKVNDPAKSLPAAIAELKKQKAEVLVLLSHAEKSESVELAKKFPEFQLVATARGPEDGEDNFETNRQVAAGDRWSKGKTRRRRRLLPGR